MTKDETQLPLIVWLGFQHCPLSACSPTACFHQDLKGSGYFWKECLCFNGPWSHSGKKMVQDPWHCGRHCRLLNPTRWFTSASFPWRPWMNFLSVSCVCMHAQSCPTLCSLKDYNPLGSSIHGILQARILEWIAIPFSRDSFLTQGLNQHLLCLLGFGRQVLYY